MKNDNEFNKEIIYRKLTGTYMVKAYDFFGKSALTALQDKLKAQSAAKRRHKVR